MLRIKIAVGGIMVPRLTPSKSFPSPVLFVSLTPPTPAVVSVELVIAETPRPAATAMFSVASLFAATVRVNVMFAPLPPTV